MIDDNVDGRHISFGGEFDLRKPSPMQASDADPVPPTSPLIVPPGEAGDSPVVRDGSARRLTVTLAAGFVAGLAAWVGGEACLDVIKPPRHPVEFEGDRPESDLSSRGSGGRCRERGTGVRAPGRYVRGGTGGSRRSRPQVRPGGLPGGTARRPRSVRSRRP